MKEASLSCAKKDLDNKFVATVTESQDETDSSNPLQEKATLTLKKEKKDVRVPADTEKYETDSSQADEAKCEPDSAQLSLQKKEQSKSPQVCTTKTADQIDAAHPLAEKEDGRPSKENLEMGPVKENNLKRSESINSSNSSSSSSNSRQRKEDSGGSSKKEEPDHSKTLNKNVKKIQEKERAKVSGKFFLFSFTLLNADNLFRSVS
jgi:hypothetical protein